MKTTIIDVRDLLSPLSARGVEKQLAKMPGVMRVEVNSVSGSATVLYDERVADLSTIEAKVRECGHHCGGELSPKHLCEQVHPLGDGHATADTAKATPVAATSPAPTQHRLHAGHVEPAGPAQAVQPVEHADMDSMGHEMGHGAGMDMQAMARDMRNRFFLHLPISTCAIRGATARASRRRYAIRWPAISNCGHVFLEQVLPAFKWLTWPGFLLRFVERFLYGVYAGLVFVPICNDLKRCCGNSAQP